MKINIDWSRFSVRKEIRDSLISSEVQIGRRPGVTTFLFRLIASSLKSSKKWLNPLSNPKRDETFAIAEKAAVLKSLLVKCSDTIGMPIGRWSFDDISPCTEGYVEERREAAEDLVQVDWAKAFVKTTASRASLSILGDVSFPYP
jgi:hypothetical protein